MNGSSDWSPVAEGEESQAFAVRFGDDEYIVRINRSADGFHKDGFCYRRFASPKLPIPEIAAIGRLDDEYAYCVSRRAPGITVQDTSPAELPSVAGAVARVMEAIAGADMTGTERYGPFNAQGIGRFASWRDYMMSILDTNVYDWEAVMPILDRKRIARYMQPLEAFAPRCPEVRRLVHGDFGSNNLLTDGGRITGVIDWSEALFGDPLYDVANIFYWRTWLDCMEVQARYFERQHPEIARHAEALRSYQLRIGLDVIYQSAAAGDMRFLEWAMARCGAVAGS
ncbi:phosphotransferase family protein [Paenibacillus lycopersici]